VADNVTVVMSRDWVEYVLDQAEPRLAKLMIRCERRAKGYCPVDTGRLRSSISHRVARVSRDKLQGVVFTNVAYGRHVELGTSRRASRSFLRRGAIETVQAGV
jgi:Bacteriophage HK97-gp10, putative tail-component